MEKTMSETSFDTSAADTLTSGLSLGQFIKDVAEENQPDKWLDMQTSDREWHVLQGEPVLNRTTQIKSNEESISDVATIISNQEYFVRNPHSYQTTSVNQNDLSKSSFCSKSPQNLASSEFATPVVSDRCGIAVSEKFSTSNWQDIQFGTPMRSSKPYTVSAQPNILRVSQMKKLSKPVNEEKKLERCMFSLSPHNISNVLEKDDSLAQRVQDLLEDNASIHSEMNEPNLLQSTKVMRNEIPLLLKTASNSSNDSTIKPTSEQHFSETFHDNRITLSDNSLNSAQEKPMTSQTLNSENLLLSSLNLFDHSGFNVPTLDNQSFSENDPLESLNASRGTEYGDLPEKVDIPKGIVDCLNTMKKISEGHLKVENANFKRRVRPAWTENSLAQANCGLLTTSVVSDSTPSINTSKSNQEALPILGDAKLYVGSNPTTPQLPIEIEKLKQLQKYIEKKIGQPYISPLLYVKDTADTSNIPTPCDNKCDNSAFTIAHSSQPVTKDEHSDYSASKVNATQSSPDNILMTSNARFETPVTSENILVSSNSADCWQRCEPEGMSPPVNNATTPLLSKVSTSPTKSLAGRSTVSNSKEQLVDNNTSVSLDNSMLSEALNDESLIARIRSALSDSFAHGPPADEMSIDPSQQSERSLNSSIDSLAMHVKALLKEELPQDGKSFVNNQNTSNLSEMIENFEQTDLWKFVAQFLPAANNPSEAGDSVRQADASVNESTLTESTIEHSLINQIRAEFKNSLLQESLNANNDVGDRQTSEMPSLRDNPTSSGLPPSTRSEKQSIESKESILVLNDKDLHMSNEQLDSVDVVPDISNFSPGIVAESSNLSISPTNSRSLVNEETHENNTAVQTRFSTYKESAKTVIANQLDRAAQRNFDVSLTPAKHSVFLSRAAGTEKAKQESSPVVQHTTTTSSEDKKSKPPLIQSAYFAENNRSNPVHKNCEDKRVSERSLSSRLPESPSSSGISRNTIEEKTSSLAVSKPLFEKSTNTEVVNSAGQRASVTPVVSSGVPFPSSKYKLLSSPQRSDPLSYGQKGVQNNSRSFGSRDPQMRSHDDSVSSSIKSRTKSPLRDRVTVQDWLKSPERKEKLKKEKPLPTFDELMEAAKREEEAKKEKEIADATTKMESLRSQYRFFSSDRDSAPSHGFASSAPDKTLFQYPEKLDSKQVADGEKSSVYPQVDGNDSYQQASLNTAGIATLASVSSPQSAEDSDVSLHRRFINFAPSSSDLDARQDNSSSRKKIPQNVDEFQSMDKKSQNQFLQQVLKYINRKNVSTSSNKARKSHNDSIKSNQAVCDSDSTEYCDLPSTRAPTSNTFDNSYSRSMLSLDEASAERIMKKLIEKINRQKNLERQGKKKISHKRSAASSSTPQKRCPVLAAPEASSIASTDTDAAVKYKIVRDKKYSGHKKVAYVEDVSENDAAVLRVKRKPKRHDPAPQRIVLHDRSVQTVTSADSLSTGSDPVISKGNKISIAIQTTGVKKSKPISSNTMISSHENKENLGASERRTDQRRFSSFFVDHQNTNQRNKTDQRAKPRKEKGVAWYEPFKYQPLWMNQHRTTEMRGLEALSLQDALAVQNPEFISRSRERQRRILINTDERRLQEIWEEERERVFGKKKFADRGRSEPIPRRPLQISRKQMVAETREKYEQLPEVVKRKEDERRKREYATNRLKAQLFKKKIQNRVLRKCYS